MPRKPSSSRISLAAALRAAADASGESDTALARRAGVARSQITRFRRGDRALSLDAADAVCEALGLHLVARGGGWRVKGGGPKTTAADEPPATTEKTPAAQTTTPGTPAHTGTAPDSNASSTE